MFFPDSQSPFPTNFQVTRKRAEQRRPRMTSGGRNALGRRRINLGSTDGDRDPNEQQTGARSPEAQAEEAYGMKHFYWKVITTLSAVFFLLGEPKKRNAQKFLRSQNVKYRVL